MSSRSRTKLRLVKCPKCAKILPEPEQVRVYACGGCDTVLQAKYYRNDNNTSRSNLHEEEIVHAPDVGEFDGSSHRSSSSGQQSFDQDEKRHHSVEIHCNSSQRESVNSAYSNSLSDESTFLDNEDHTRKQIGDSDFDGENSMRSESQVHENEEPNQFGTVNGAKEDEDDQLEKSDDHKHVREASILDESLGTQNKESLKLAPEYGEVRVNDDENGGNDFVECISEKLEGINLRDKDSTVSLEIGEIDSVSAYGSTKVSRVAQCERSSPSDNVMETSPRKIENFGDCPDAYESDHLKSVEAVNTVHDSTKVGPRFPTKGSFANYEESVSSFDGNDDQLPRQHEVMNEDLPFGDRIKLSRHGIPPRVPPVYRSSEVTYETGSSSSYVQDELPGHHTRHHPYMYDDKSENWLRKPHFQKGNVGGRRRRFSEATLRENELLPMYYSYETSGEIYQRSKYYDNGYHDRKRRSESWCQTQSGSLPRIPYSSEVLNGRYQIPGPYNTHRYRYPDDLRWSAQLPMNGVCCQGQCIAPSREIGWDPYESLSYPTSPRHLMGLEPYPCAQDSTFLSDDQRDYKYQIMRRLHLREKRQAVKRHLEPLAGGAPFVTCYFCFRVLRLPGDFLLPGRRRRRRTHLLKCGACSNILEFFLDNECCLVSCVANNDSEDAPTDVGRNCNLASEGDKVEDEDGREVLSKDDSFGGSDREKGKAASMNEERREKSGDEEGGGCSSVEQGRQMKVTWQLPARTKSPLHRLMGYSSPRDLLIRSDEDAEI